MLIDYKNIDLDFVLNLDKVYQDNYSSSELLNVILEDYYDALCNIKISNSKNMFFELMKIIKEDNDEDIIEKDYLKELCKENKIDKIDLLDYSLYSSNPYLRNIKFKPIKLGKYNLSYNYYEENELFLYDDVTNFDLKEIQHLGYFNKKLNYPYISYENNVWMNVTPFEINTMKEHILKAKGKVLALGLGLGYFPYMCSLKDEVEEICIVENDINIIKLFNEHILPLFTNKNMIKIINCDGIEYLKKNHSSFDFVFVDIYRNTLDGLKTFIDVYDLNLDLKNVEFWLYRGIINQLKRCVFFVFLNEYFKEDDRFSNSYFYSLSMRIKKALKDYRIEKNEYLFKILDYKYLLKLLKNK